MHPELERTLCERHPKIFPLHVSDANAVPFHFACDDGWFDLLDVLAGALQAETDNRGAPQLVAKQVKQKFGSLRFYTDTAGSSTQEALIDLAMRLSLRMCEVCGARAREHCRDDGKGLTGWTLVRCDVHAEGFTRQGIGKQ